jgi:hypothetical protein
MSASSALKEGANVAAGRTSSCFAAYLPDGRWFDEQAATWRDRRGRREQMRYNVDKGRLRAARLAGRLGTPPSGVLNLSVGMLKKLVTN